MPTTDTRALYTESAHAWVRDQPTSLSDFTARPRVLELCGDLRGRRVLDLGCGEGYVARQLARAGAQVLGIDLSPGMIEQARRQEQAERLGIAYDVGDAAALAETDAHRFDLVVAVFLFNYLTVSEMRTTMRRVHAALRPGGTFIFTVPHPAFAFMRAAEPPFYFDVGDHRYQGAVDRKFPGRIWKCDGTALDVQMRHKTLADYVAALADASFTALPLVEELGVTEAIAAAQPRFRPLVGYPLHLAFKTSRSPA
ncbi:MAG TPA: class I SAM-dependent methyltransferase [Kofleriaceae bacterium]|nr:class I SAM-dependent methyltransferase [Kofleriaceae bacterium]